MEGSGGWAFSQCTKLGLWHGDFLECKSCDVGVRRDFVDFVFFRGILSCVQYCKEIILSLVFSTLRAACSPNQSCSLSYGTR